MKVQRERPRENRGHQLPPRPSCPTGAGPPSLKRNRDQSEDKRALLGPNMVAQPKDDTINKPDRKSVV